MHLNSSILFLDKKTKKVPNAKKFYLILSPSFYWFKKESLAVSPRQARKLAPSVFEGILPEGEYSYYVYKNGEEYWFFAYNDREIIQKLNNLGIKPAQIIKVYPAQTALKNITSPVTTDETTLANENGTIVALPQNFPTQSRPIQESDIFFAKNSLPLRAYSGTISEELLLQITIILLVAIITYSFEIFIYKKDIDTLIAKEQHILQKYNIPQTSFQIRSILSSLHKIQKEQLDLRKKFDYLLKIPLLPAEYFTKVEFAKNIKLEIILSSPKRAPILQKYLAKEFIIQDIKVVDKKMIVKCSV